MSNHNDDVLEVIRGVNPYVNFLSNSSFSRVDEFIDTGSYVLNALISGSVYKGIPYGRVVQFAGPSQTFKSGFVQQILANAQKKGLTPVIFDTENAIDPDGAERLGLDVSKVIHVPSTTVEGTRNAIYKFLSYVKEKGKEGEFILAVDSVANLQSVMEITRMEKDSDSADVGTFAKAVKSLMKTLTNMATLTRTPAIVTNHVYDNPMAMFPSIEQNIAGGKSAAYLPSITVQLARKLVADDDGKTLDSKLSVAQKKYSGVVIRALTTKNRLIKQYLEGEMYLSFSSGLNKYYGLLELMKGMGVVDNKGSIYYDWTGEKLGFQKNFRNDKKLWEEKLVPEFDSRIMAEWAYGNIDDDIPEEEDDEVVKEEQPVEDESPVAVLKKIKKKVSSKIDELELEEKKEENE